MTKPQRTRVAEKYELRDDGLHRITVQDGEAGYTLVVPRLARAAILSKAHRSLADGAGHVGGQTMYEQLRRDYFWADMERECHAFAAGCQRCGETRSQGTIGADLHASPTPDAPFQVIHLDHKGPLPLSNGYTAVLVVVCALTKFTLYIPVRDTKATTTLAALRDHVFAIFGYPLVIISDNGSSFANKLMNASQRLFGFRHIFVMPHTPQANGLAEAAVKKLKLIMDRHTFEYEGWHALIGMAQSAVNQRITSGSQECPFVALFGRRPVTLTAIENPSLLPVNAPEEKSVKELAFALSRLHRRLAHEVDAIKDAAVHAADQGKTRRTVLPGDRVWLTYSDSERARYLRKHGHGTAWRHAFTVLEVQPHAVRLEIPRDGSVPDVLPWQSLRKCSLAAPRFHHDDLPSPSVDSAMVPMVPEVDDGVRSRPAPAEPPEDAPAIDPTGWSTWTPSSVYEIERIVSAEMMPNGKWRLHVMWKGYDGQITPEPMKKILETVTDPALLAEIERLKEEFLASHPNLARPRVPAATVPRPEPTRVVPARDRGQVRRFMYQLSPSNEGCEDWFFAHSISMIRATIGARAKSLRALASEAFDYARPLLALANVWHVH